MDDTELNFIMKMTDQASSVLQGVGASFNEVGNVVKQQVAAMQSLASAMTGHAKAASEANSAARAQAEGLKVVNSALGEHVNNARKSEEANKSLAASMTELREGAEGLARTLVGLYATNEMIKSPLEAYREQEAAITKIANAAGIARSEVDEMHEALAKVSMQNGKATIEQLDQFAVMGARLGGTAEQIQKFAVAVGNIARGDLGIGQQVSQILSATGDGIEGVEKLANALKALGTNARSGMDGLTSMTTMLSNFTAGMDVNSTKLVAYAATFDKVFGAEMGRRAGAQFGIILQTITRQAEEGGEGLRDLADRFGDTYDAMQKLAAEHPDEVFNKILEVVNAMKQGGQNPATFLKEFGIDGGRAVQTLEALAEKSKQLQQNLADANDPSKLLAKQKANSANDPNKEYVAAVNEMTTAWTEFKAKVGEDISPEMIVFFKTATVALRSFTDIVLATPTPIRMVVEAILILGPTLTNVGRIASLVGSQYKGFTELLTREVGVAKDKVQSASAQIVRAENEIGAASLRAKEAVETNSVEMAGATEAAASRMSRAMATTANLAKGAFAGILAGYSVAEASGVIRDLAIQGVKGYRRGVDVEDFGNAMGGLLPSFLGGDYFRNNLQTSLQSKKNAGTLKWDFSHKSEGGEAGEGSKESSEAKAGAEGVKASGTNALQGLGESARAQLAPYNDLIKKQNDFRDTADSLKKVVDNLSDAQRQQFASEIEGAQQALELRKAELDPLNKMRDDWIQAMQAAKAYTAAQKEAADIEKQVFDARQQAVKDGRNPDQAESAVRQQQTSLNATKRDTEYMREAQGLQQSLAMAAALTQTEKDRLGVEQQIANLARDKTYTQEQLDQLKQILEITKQIERENQQFQTLNPQAKALQDYNDQLNTLNQRLRQGTVSQQEFNREKTVLDQQTLAARSPIGNIVQQERDEAAQLQITGKYREADLKTLQQITELKRQGVLSDDASSKAIESQLGSNNRMLQDIKDLQGQLDSLTQSFGSGLSSAIGQALNGQKYAFEKFLASMGQKMMDMAFQNIAKSLEPNLNGLLGGVFGNANTGINKLGDLAKGQQMHTIASAQQSIAQAQITVANATMASGQIGQVAASNGAVSPLPAPSGTSLAGAAGVVSAGAGALSTSGASAGTATQVIAQNATPSVRVGGAEGALPAGAATFDPATGKWTTVGSSGSPPVTPPAFAQPGGLSAANPSSILKQVTGGGSSSGFATSTPAALNNPWKGQSGGIGDAWPRLAAENNPLSKTLGINTPSSSPANWEFQKTQAEIASQMNPDLVKGLQKLGSSGTLDPNAMKTNQFGQASAGIPGAQGSISLSGHDISSIAKVAYTEVAPQLKKIAPAQYDLQRQGVVDTMLNRYKTGEYGHSIDDIANKKWQFTQITRNGGLDKTPEAPGWFKREVQDDISSRATGSRQDVTGGGQSYLNPSFSDAKSLNTWGNPVIAQGRGFGVGNMTQYYGVAPGDKPVRPYNINMPGQQGAQPSGQGGMPALPQVAPGQMKVFGDSIGDGVKKALGADGSTLTGMNPSQVLGVLKGQGAKTAQGAIAGYSGGNLNGQNVVLSSGVSNNPAQIGLVGQQIDQLKSMGAGNISLLGTGTRADLAPLNSRLAEIAKEHGAQFQGALDPTKIGPDGVHPTLGGYQSIATRLKAQQQAMPRNTGVDTAPTGSISSAAKQMQDASHSQLNQALEAAKQTQDQLKQSLTQSSQSFTQNFTSLSSGISKTGQTALGAVPDMGSFSNSISQMVQKLSSSGGGGLGGLFGGGGGDGFGDFAAFHSGGKVGSLSGGYLRRTVRASVFHGAPRFHDGLNSDEYPAILQRGERVLTNAQEQRTTSIVDKLADAVANQRSPSSERVTPAQRERMGSRINMVVNTRDANSFRLSQPQIMAQAHAAMMRSGAKHN